MPNTKDPDALFIQPDETWQIAVAQNERDTRARIDRMRNKRELVEALQALIQSRGYTADELADLIQENQDQE